MCSDVLQTIAGLTSPGLLRLVCKDWREAVDLSVTELTPAVCEAEQILLRFQNVTALNLSEACASVTDDTLAVLCRLSNLRTLNLQGCAKVGSVCQGPAGTMYCSSVLRAAHVAVAAETG